MDIGARLQEKWGALPVWAWGAIVAGVAMLAYFAFFKNNHAGNTISGGSTIDPKGYQTSGIQGGTATTETTVPESNAGWLNRVSRMVSSALSQSPSEVYSALQKWLSGQDISQREQSWVDKAIELGMAPPEGTTGSSTVTPSQDNVTIKGYYTRGLARGRPMYWGIVTTRNGVSTGARVPTQEAANALAKQHGNFSYILPSEFNKRFPL